MKKALIVTNVLTLVLLYMSSFTATKKETPVITNGPNCDDIVMNYQNSPISGIALSTAQTMATNYQGRFSNTCITPYFKLNHKNSKSVWFSLERLKSFIWEIESRMCNKNCKSDKPDSLGVRIYFGAYPNFNALSAAARKDYNVLPGSYIKYNSVFFVPTYYDSKNNINIDFDPRNMGANECKPTPLSTYLKGTGVKFGGTGGVQSFNRFVLPPLSGPSLILTANETQFFKGENPAKIFAMANDNTDNLRRGGPANFLFPYAVQSVMNHGNIIPPEVDNGTAF